jgi:hypothetical protein
MTCNHQLCYLSSPYISDTCTKTKCISSNSVLLYELLLIYCNLYFLPHAYVLCRKLYSHSTIWWMERSFVKIWGFHNSDHLVECDAVRLLLELMIQRHILPPSSGLTDYILKQSYVMFTLCITYNTTRYLDINRGNKKLYKNLLLKKHSHKFNPFKTKLKSDRLKIKPKLKACVLSAGGKFRGKSLSLFLSLQISLRLTALTSESN